MQYITQKGSTPVISRQEGKNAWKKAETLFFLFSFSLPFLMALFFYLTSKYTFAEIFNSERVISYVLVGVVFFFVFTFFLWYLFSKRPDVFIRNSTKWILVATFALPFLLAPILSYYLSDFIIPLVFCGLVVFLLIDDKLAYIINAVIPIIFSLSYYMINPYDDLFHLFSSATIQLVSGCFVLILAKKRYTRLSFLLQSLFVGVVIAFPLTIVLSLLSQGDTWRNFIVNGIYASLSILISLASFMVLTPLYEVAFRLYSNFRLEEICAANAPLIEKLAKEAPGTYNHSIAMSILAQDCAKAIGENPALAKAGACYHDIGKLYNPICFSENQTTYNPHDNYIPEVSVTMITKHTTEGAAIIRRNRLPEELAQIAEEHHGDQTVSYFLNKSIKMTDEKMNSDLFKYKGPRPSTKISAIIMIVDTVEAATRAQGINKDERQFRAFIHSLIESKVNAQQFTDCPLTFKDLTIIEETLLKSVPAIYHQRIKYTK